jgi:mono/diheme cytochrome c family protein
MKPFLRRGMYAVGGLFGLLAVTVGGVYGVSQSHFNQRYVVQTATLMIPSDSASIAHGMHLAHSRGCMDCHGENLGGAVFIEDPAMGRLIASNLTAGVGGVGAHFDATDWDLAIRHGVRRDGKPLMFMPSYEYAHWSDGDLIALVAYLQTVEPVDNELPSNRVGPMARALYLAGKLPLVPAEMIDHTPRERVAPAAGPTVEYGAYVAPSCTGCHGEGFSGGQIPGVPPDWPLAANITLHESGLAGWTEEDFFRALREGIRPDGTEIQQPYMPIAVTKHLHDYEIRALWAYLNTLAPRQRGNR